MAEDASEVEESAVHISTNLILYGPPGTGKTYRTAWEAVRLCHGDAAAHNMSGKENRAALMAEYGKLVASGRVEFVTFHQSMSYEEFVEGLRPQTGAASTDAPEPDKVDAGFRLEPCDGVFKRACARAERDVGEAAGADRLDRSRRIIRLGLTGSNWRDKLDLALTKGRIEWPHGGSIDWSPPEYESWEAIKTKRQETAPDVIGSHPTVYGTWLFRGANVEEYIALTVGLNKIVALGRLSGEYRFEAPVGGHPPLHLRPVRWLWHDGNGIDRAGIYDKEFTSFHTAYPMDRDKLNWDALDALVYGAAAVPARQSARAHVLIIDEINRANISKVFGELITLLEPDKRIGMPNEIRLTLPYSKKHFGVPANLHIIGTMNTADRSIALLDTALRRRFAFLELMPDPSELSTNLEGINLQKLLATINERIEYLFDRDHLIGHAYFTSCRSRNEVEAVMRQKVIPLLAEYFYEDWSKVAAVLGDSQQEGQRFLIREQIAPPAGLAAEELYAPRYRWRVLPPRDAMEQGGFDFSEFAAE